MNGLYLDIMSAVKCTASPESNIREVLGGGACKVQLLWTRVYPNHLPEVVTVEACVLP